MNRRERGQALVEFSLVAVFVFFPMLLGLIEGARLIYTNNMLSNAAREGARLGSVQGGWIGDSGNGCNSPAGQVCPSLPTFSTNILAAANGELIGATPLAPTNVTITCGGAPPTAAACAAGAKLTVAVTYTYVPFLPGFSSTSIHLGATSSMVIQ